MKRFGVPSEEIPDKMGQEAPALLRGLLRQVQPAQPADLHLASQKQGHDRPEGYGDGARDRGTAGGADQSALGGEPVRGFPADRRFTGKAMVQHRRSEE